MVKQITAILRWGTGAWQTVMLECGHHQKVRRERVKWEQLFVGKRIHCAMCEGDKRREE